MESTPPVATTVTYDEFTKLDIRVATILECKDHPNADKLLIMQIDVGGGERRQICAGLRNHYNPEQLVGKQIVLVTNLASRMMRGQISQGMLLAATDTTPEGQERVILLGLDQPVAAGCKVR
jgi:methionyl-tRNA synthetase